LTRSPTFAELIDEGNCVSVEGWDFSWFAGRASEERPSWGYARMLPERVARAGAVLDVQTGGGEVLAEVLAEVLGNSPARPATVAATESWPPNVEVARRNLGPYGASVVEVPDDAALPFPSGTFDLVVSRHPTVVVWDEVARVLRAGGTYLSQQIGPGSVHELTDFMMGPQPIGDARSSERARMAAQAAGLTVVDLRDESLRTEFHDVGAVVHFLRKVIWIVPGFTVDRYRDRLAELHERIQADGPFVAYARRLLIEAHKPGLG
jgi:SAM-dependent methyltransferase